MVDAPLVQHLKSVYGVLGAGQLDAARREVDAEHFEAARGEERRHVPARTAAGVHHTAATRHPTGERIEDLAVEWLVVDLFRNSSR